MLGDIRQAQKVYIVCGYTDMRKGLNSLVPFVQQNFGIDPYSSSLFLFCGKRCDRLKALLWEPDGFVQWPAALTCSESFKLYARTYIFNLPNR